MEEQTLKYMPIQFRSRVGFVAPTIYLNSELDFEFNNEIIKTDNLIVAVYKINYHAR